MAPVSCMHTQVGEWCVVCNSMHRDCLRPGVVAESVMLVVLLNLELQELAYCPGLGGVCSVNVY